MKAEIFVDDDYEFNEKKLGIGKILATLFGFLMMVC